MKIVKIVGVLLLWIPLVASQSVTYTADEDASWAVRSPVLSSILGDDKQVLYDNYIQGCQDAAQQRQKVGMNCQRDDHVRLNMNRLQPASVRNYTNVGYKKIRAPKELFALIQNFYNENKGQDEVEWKDLNIYHNMWECPPTIMHMSQDRFTDGGPQLQNKIWSTAKSVLEEWSGQELSPVSLYGIRLYHNGSILAPHVDRFPLISSAIINVDQDVDEPWPLEVYGHDGKAVNVTMAPGDMVLYESHSVIHGRPFPLNGKFFANVFVHFEVIGADTYDAELDLPPYLIPGSPWETVWRSENKNGWKGNYLDARTAAKKGDVEALKRVATTDPKSFLTPDENGWTPFHEAVRVGNKQAVEVILQSDEGSNINNKLKNLVTYTGVTPLSIARQFLGKDHEVTEYLIEVGAIDIHPGYTNSPEQTKGAPKEEL